MWAKMSKKVPRRDVTPLLKHFRDFLLGRKYNEANRFADEMAPRPGPKPNLPGGPASEQSLSGGEPVLSKNYYLGRDTRREYLPPVDVVNQKPAIADGQQKEETAKSTGPRRKWPPLPMKRSLGIPH